jgi:ATPase subunit of ABC transporter with duplicated ATPase domains
VVDVRQGTLTDYLGDYDRYLEKQQGGRAESASANSQGTGAAPVPNRATLTSKQERIAGRDREKQRKRNLNRARKRLAAIEEDLIEREEELEGLSNQLAEPHVYRDGEAVQSIEVARAELRSAIEEGYGEWERVAAEIEALEVAAKS